MTWNKNLVLEHMENQLCNGTLKKVKIIKKEDFKDFIKNYDEVELSELYEVVEKFSNYSKLKTVDNCSDFKRIKKDIEKGNYLIYLPSKTEKKFFETLKEKYSNISNDNSFYKFILDYNKSSIIFIEHILRPYLTPVLLGNNKFYFINITKHALERFVKRLLILVSTYYNHNNIGKKLKKDYHVLLESINNEKISEKSFNYIAKRIMLDYLKSARPLKENKTLYRKADKKNLKFRKSRYDDENEIIRVYQFPFLFLVNYKKYIIKTTELYSSNLKKLNILNKMTSSREDLEKFVKFNNIKLKREFKDRKEEIKQTVAKLLKNIIQG